MDCVKRESVLTLVRIFFIFLFFRPPLSLFIKQRIYKILNNPAGSELDCFSHRTQNDSAVSFKTLVCG